ncbi:VanZ family protein [Pantoea sp. 18069]|uniref:VanZ family protein n=1 Tax=Pantoea sp. 18069 TaxID=2681415 RepID=UPI001357DD26|nr:VanZ family protein [Pantoea sp. 18069]
MPPAWAWRLAAFGWAAAMAWGCLQEAGGSAPALWRLPHIDKLAHAGMHALLAWLLWRSVGRATLRTGISIVALCAAYGLAIEWGQWQFTLTRSAEALDALANTLGAVLGVTPGLRPARHGRARLAQLR